MRSKLSIFSLIGAALLLSACTIQGGGSSNTVETSEDLLQAEGQWKMVEKDSQPVPAAMHSQAKADVNVRDMKRHMEYAAKARKAAKKDTNFRLLVLEQQMDDVNNELKKYIPGHAPKKYDSYASLGLPEPVSKPVAEVIAQAKKKAKSKPAPVLTGDPAVHKVRLGEHPGKTRLVLDLNKPSHFSYDLDNAEKLLLIDVKGAGWKTSAQKAFAKHPLLAGYSAHDNGSGGTMLVLELKKAVKVGMNTAMKPHKAGGYHRIVFDLIAQ